MDYLAVKLPALTFALGITLLRGFIEISNPTPRDYYDHKIYNKIPKKKYFIAGGMLFFGSAFVFDSLRHL